MANEDENKKTTSLYYLEFGQTAGSTNPGQHPPVSTALESAALPNASKRRNNDNNKQQDMDAITASNLQPSAELPIRQKEDSMKPNSKPAASKRRDETQPVHNDKPRPQSAATTKRSSEARSPPSRETGGQASHKDKPRKRARQSSSRSPNERKDNPQDYQAGEQNIQPNIQKIYQQNVSRQETTKTTKTSKKIKRRADGHQYRARDENRRFACPLAKVGSFLYLQCIDCGYPDIRRVREHLVDAHSGDVALDGSEVQTKLNKGEGDDSLEAWDKFCSRIFVHELHPVVPLSPHPETFASYLREFVNHLQYTAVAEVERILKGPIDTSLARLRVAQALHEASKPWFTPERSGPSPPLPSRPQLHQDYTASGSLITPPPGITSGFSNLPRRETSSASRREGFLLSELSRNSASQNHSQARAPTSADGASQPRPAPGSLPAEALYGTPATQATTKPQKKSRRSTSRKKRE